jgi:hypothetical protein
MRFASHAAPRSLLVALAAVVFGGAVAACGSSSEHSPAAAALGAGSSSAKAHPSSVAGAANVLVVQGTPVSQAIPAGFVGLSLGYSTLALYAGTNPDAVDPVFEQLIRNLAPGQSPVLRLAGTDGTWWPVPHVPRPPGVTFSLTERYLRVARALAQAVDARFIFGINFEADSTVVAGAEARELLGAVGRQWIDALELGNEPELYRSFAWYRLPDGQRVNGRPAGWSFSNLVQDFANISRALPSTVTLAGPAMGSSAWIPLIGQFLAGNPRVGLVTLHRYPLKHCSANIPVTIPELLSGASSTGLAASVAPEVAIAQARGAQLRIGEMGAIACGGMPGVSDSFASALWSLDALFAMARVNVDGVNLNTASYALNRLFGIGEVNGRWQARVSPVYYGALMFAQAAPAGSRLLAISGTAGADVDAWATRAPDGTIHVVLINDDTRHSHAVAVELPSAGGPATLEWLRAPSIGALSGVTLGGQSFGAQTDTGLLAGAPVTASVAPVAGEYLVRLPVASAAMLTLPAG